MARPRRRQAFRLRRRKRRRICHRADRDAQWLPQTAAAKRLLQLERAARAGDRVFRNRSVTAFAVAALAGIGYVYEITERTYRDLLRAIRGSIVHRPLTHHRKVARVALDAELIDSTVALVSHVEIPAGRIDGDSGGTVRRPGFRHPQEIQATVSLPAELGHGALAIVRYIDVARWRYGSGRSGLHRL